MKRIGIVAILVIAMVAAMAGCGSTATPDTSASTAPSATEAPSKAATEAPTEAATEAPAEPVSIKTAGSTSVGPVIEALAEKYMAEFPNVEITVEAGGSGVGVTSCGEKTVDFGMASRNLKDDEIATYPDMKATVLCLDGVAIVVNSANKVADLTKDQIKQIYLGEITDWSEVGGDAGKINLYTRDSASGTRGAFQELFLGKDDAGEEIVIDETICAGVFDSNGALATAVQGDAMGIGYMSLGIVPSYDGIAATKVDGVEATVDDMKNGSYKYSRNFNLLTMGDPTGEVAKFFEYCMTNEEALAYMAEKGYVMPTA
jgi:phosphate transport system substrate-binding protein